MKYLIQQTLHLCIVGIGIELCQILVDNPNGCYQYSE